jgi:DNA-binding transcriptional ArsR family regulator
MTHMPAARERQSATLEEVRALAHPLRLRIIRLTYDRSLTNKELASELGENPATVLHHVRTLLRTGFLEPDRERPGPRGTVEKPYRSTGKSWNLDVDTEATANQVARASIDAFLAEISRVSDSERLSTTRAPMRLTEERRREFEQKVMDLMDEYAGDVDSGGDEAGDGERLALFLAVYPRG